MGYPLAPHLRHAGSGAWFEPITLTAGGFPTSVSEAVFDEEKLAHVHEYVHYLQATTTFFGLTRFHTLWWSMSEFSTLLTQSDDSLEAKQKFIARHQEKLDSLEYLAVPLLLDIETPIEPGPHYVDTGSRHIGVYAKSKEDYTRLFPLGAEALQESMVMALERWYGYSEDTYQLALQADDAAFYYAVGIESLRAMTGWDDETLWWLTIVLCDIALDHLLPYYAFYYGAQYLKEQYPIDKPKFEDLRVLYLVIQDAIRIDEVDEERQKLRTELEGIIKRSKASDDVFDQAFVRLLERICEGLDLRQQQPTVFVEHLLDMGSSIELLDRFHLPCYQVDERLLTLTTDEHLVNAVLFLIAQMHYLTCFVDDKKDKMCPFYNNREHCQFERVTECEQVPWKRPEKNKDACIYRFVAHRLARKAK